MATSLFQQNCTCAGHLHHHDRHSHAYGLQTFVGVPAASFQCCQEARHGVHGHGEQTLSTVPSISAPISNGLGGETKMLEPRAYPFNHVKQTRASYRRDAFASSPSQIIGGKGINSWALCLPVPIPKDIPDATLESMEYTIRYGSQDTGSANVHADVVLSRGVKVDEGIVVDYSKVPMYNFENAQPGGGYYGLLTVNEETATRVASVPGFKNAGAGWSHYLDHQKVFPNIKVGSKEGCQLYLFFHVYEYAGGDAQRNLTVDVLATWNDGEELRLAKEEREREIKEMRKEREQMVLVKNSVEEAIKNLQENERKANDESQKRIKAEQDKIRELEEKERSAQAEYEKRKKEEEERRRAFDEAEKKAQDGHAQRMKEVEARLKELTQAEAQARAKAEADRKAKEEADRKAKEEADRKAKEAAVAKAPAVADEKMQQQIAEIAKKLNRQCPQGFAWNKVEGGYKCGGGGHFLTFAELGMA